MANRVYSVEDIELQGWNDSEGNPIPIRIHPLTIKRLRGVFEKIDVNADENKDKTYVDLMLGAVAESMKTFEPKLSKVSVLENHIDEPTMVHILKIAAGLEFGNENLTKAMEAMDGIK